MVNDTNRPLRRRSSIVREDNALLDAEPKTPEGTPAIGTEAHNSWLNRALGWADNHLYPKAPIAYGPRTPSTKLGAEQADAAESHEQRRHDFGKRQRRLRVGQVLKAGFDPSRVELQGYNKGIPTIKYAGLGHFDFETWCCWVGLKEDLERG